MEAKPGVTRPQAKEASGCQGLEEAEMEPLELLEQAWPGPHRDLGLWPLGL